MLKPVYPFITALLTPFTSMRAADAQPETFSVREDFGPGFDAKKFLTPIPNKNTIIRDGVMWTHGSSGGKYPPMVYLALDGKDLTVTFRYHPLERVMHFSLKKSCTL